MGSPGNYSAVADRPFEADCKVEVEKPCIFTFHCHYRRVDEDLKTVVYDDGKHKGELVNPRGITSHGGCTVAVIEINNKLCWSVARCRNSDVFCKRDGRIKAYGRARSRSAAITPMLDIEGVKCVSDELARIWMYTNWDYEESEIILPVIDWKIVQTYQIRNWRLEKIEDQKSLFNPEQPCAG